MNRFSSTLRQLAGSLPLALLVLGAVGCTVHVGWTGRYSEELSGRTPATFAAACEEIGGTLAASENEHGGAQSTCTVANGDANTCDWQWGLCRTVCHSSERQCATVRFLAYVPPGRRPATPPAPDAPAPNLPASASGAQATAATDAEAIAGS